jgi:uncharacterized damage-inducible protein DinB
VVGDGAPRMQNHSPLLGIAVGRVESVQPMLDLDAPTAVIAPADPVFAQGRAMAVVCIVEFGFFPFIIVGFEHIAAAVCDEILVGDFLLVEIVYKKTVPARMDAHINQKIIFLIEIVAFAIGKRLIVPGRIIFSGVLFVRIVAAHHTNANQQQPMFHDGVFVDNCFNCPNIINASLNLRKLLCQKNTMLKQQYELVRSARSVLLDYCETITAEHFTAENSTFGRGSIRNLLIHNANTYQWWIGKTALQREVGFTEYDAISDVAQTRALFDQIDAFMQDFFIRFEANQLEPVSASLREKTFMSTPLELFTHSITHEFHHKGQILSLSRHLGYVPADTDIIR